MSVPSPRPVLLSIKETRKACDVLLKTLIALASANFVEIKSAHYFWETIFIWSNI